MIENNPSNISSAFEMLLEEVEAEIDFVNGVGAKALEGRDYDRAKEALERSGVLTALRDKLAALRKDWEQLAAAAERDEDEETRAERRNLGKLRKGLRTPEAAYYKPILKDVDYDPLASGPDNPRWRNAGQWARNSMVNEGLLKRDSPRGIWEITDAGRQVLREQA